MVLLLCEKGWEVVARVPSKPPPYKTDFYGNLSPAHPEPWKHRELGAEPNCHRQTGAPTPTSPLGRAPRHGESDVKRPARLCPPQPWALTAEVLAANAGVSPLFAGADPAIQAGVGVAEVDLRFAVVPGETLRAAAPQASDGVDGPKEGGGGGDEGG